MNTKNRFIIIVSLSMILLSINAFAFAVTSYYWDEKPLFLNPGETIEIQAFGIQNMVGSEDIIIKVDQISGFDIAQLIGDYSNLEIPIGTKDNYVKMRITIPQNTKIGTVFDVGASFTQTNIGEGGNVQFTQGMTNNIIIVVGQKVDKSGVPIGEPTPPLEQQPSVPTAISEQQIPPRPSIVTALIFIVVLVVIILFYRYSAKHHKTSRKR